MKNVNFPLKSACFAKFSHKKIMVLVQATQQAYDVRNESKTDYSKHYARKPKQDENSKFRPIKYGEKVRSTSVIHF
jgi:hypothetical protein